MRRKGFTLVELLVVIAIIALLMGILMPALAQVRRLAQRMMCGTNLSGIGKAIMVYSNDNEEEYPRAGGRNSEWETSGEIADWDPPTTSDTPEEIAFGSAGSSVGKATMSSNFFLLIKYADCTPKQFICNGDGAKAFKLTEMDTGSAAVDDLTDAYDFGGDDTLSTPGEYCSYSYHMPFTHTNTSSGSVSHPLSSSSNPSSPVAADRNPFLDKNAHTVYIDSDGSATSSDDTDPKWNTNPDEFYDPDKIRNAAAHQQEGQNVMYADTHVRFEKKPNVGIENDNIYICWTSNYAASSGAEAKENKQFGESGGMPGGKSAITSNSSYGPWSEQDAFLVNEWNAK